MQRFVERYYNPLLLVLVAIAFFSRLYRIHIPERYMFDEVYHAVTAQLIAKNDPRAYEWTAQSDQPNTAIDWLHPPGAKLFQAGSVLLFGETSFAWRISSVVFGTLVVLTVGWLTQALFANKALSLFATLFAVCDGLLLVQSRIAMNDIHVTFFILQTLLWYWLYREKKVVKYFIVAIVMAGCAVASKWSGLFVFGVITIVELAQWQKDQTIHLLQKISLLLLLPLGIYLASYSQMWLQGKSLTHFIQLHKQIWAYQTTLTATHPYQSTPLQWFLNIRPVWVSVEYGSETRADIYAFGNPALFFWGMFAILFSAVSVVQLRKKISPAFIFLFLAYIIVWTPWFLSPRVMFFYHYTPAVPLLCILLAYWLVKINKKSLTITISISIILASIVWFPHWTQLPVSNKFADDIYFYFTTWK
ncbi:MAG: phospholipid carrier-dependent glycosyltransferase [Candidatus Pacebacteria bacterium]|nr:phospholipid carrier-dependent glycosyltransferase [Candidatus Paceibacterota bacterium]PIR60473.1 MAG: hypothetical protein COU67_01720 [Candidatus Pacebacteria bacterium CG10_big_fil_rev_8_21_14_0_10_44_54]